MVGMKKIPQWIVGIYDPQYFTANVVSNGIIEIGFNGLIEN
jgi:hypothetical protein